MSPGARQQDPWGQVSTLVAGPVAWGAIGYGVDAVVDSSVFLPAGLVLGIVASTWLVCSRFLGASGSAAAAGSTERRTAGSTERRTAGSTAGSTPDRSEGDRR